MKNEIKEGQCNTSAVKFPPHYILTQRPLIRSSWTYSHSQAFSKFYPTLRFVRPLDYSGLQCRIGTGTLEPAWFQHSALLQIIAPSPFRMLLLLNIVHASPASPTSLPRKQADAIEHRGFSHTCESDGAAEDNNVAHMIWSSSHGTERLLVKLVPFKDTEIAI